MASEFYLTTLMDCATAYNYSYMGQGLRIFGKYIPTNIGIIQHKLSVDIPIMMTLVLIE